MFLYQMTKRLKSLLLILCIFTNAWWMPVVLADDFSSGQQWSRWLGLSTYEAHRSQHFALPADAHMLIVGEVANAALSQAIAQILGSRFANVAAYAAAMDLASARQLARQQQPQQQPANFLFYYRVQQWHQGRWQQADACPQNLLRGWLCRLRPHNPKDKVQLTLWLWDVSSERLMDTITLQASSSILSFWHQSPDNLIKTPLRKVLLSYSANIN